MKESESTEHKKASAEKDPARESLVRAGLKLFARDGLEGTTVRDLAAEAGVNLSLVSYYFGGKEGLYRAVLEETGKERSTRAQEILRPPQSSEEFNIRFQLLVNEMVNFHLESPDLCKIILREVDMGLPVAADIFEQVFLKNFKMLVEFFEFGQKKGYLRKDLNPMLMAVNLQGTIFHFHRGDAVRKRYFKETTSDPKYRQKTIDELCRTFLYGIAQPQKG